MCLPIYFIALLGKVFDVLHGKGLSSLLSTVMLKNQNMNCFLKLIVKISQI